MGGPAAEWVPSAGGRSLTGVEGVGLQAVDHMVVGLQQHEVLCRVSVPDEDVAAVGAAHHKVVAPETGFFNLKRKKDQGCYRPPLDITLNKQSYRNTQMPESYRSRLSNHGPFSCIHEFLCYYGIGVKLWLVA